MKVKLLNERGNVILPLPSIVLKELGWTIGDTLSIDVDITGSSLLISREDGLKKLVSSLSTDKSRSYVDGD